MKSGGMGGSSWPERNHIMNRISVELNSRVRVSERERERDPEIAIDLEGFGALAFSHEL